MNILLITDSYPPEIRSASHLMQEMAEELRNRGHKVTVVTAYPQYNVTAELKGKSFDEFSDENGICIYAPPSHRRYQNRTMIPTIPPSFKAQRRQPAC